MGCIIQACGFSPLSPCIPSAETVFAKIRIVDTVFEKVCQMLHTRFYQSDMQLSVSTVRKLLLLLSKADRSLVEVRHRKWIDSPLVLKLIFFTQHK